MALVDMKSNLVKEPNVYTKKSAFSDESINQQYDKFNLRRDAHNSSYIKEPYILHGIQKDGGSTPNTIPLLTGAEHLVEDIARISKFFISPRGLVFLAKQVGLQLMNPKVETPVGWPLPNLPNTRIYNLGINTLSSVATPMLHPWIYMKRHGLLPIDQSGLDYGKVVRRNNELNSNRLVGMTDQYIADNGPLGSGLGFNLGLSPNGANDIIDSNRKKYYDYIQKKPSERTSPFEPKFFANRNIIQELSQINMRPVSGLMGPNSFFGVGNTNIKFSDSRTPQIPLGPTGTTPEKYSVGKDPIQINKPLNEDNKTDFTKELIKSVRHSINYGKSSPTSDEFRYSSLKYDDLKKDGKYPDFRKNLEGDTKSFSGTEDYDQHHPESFGMIDYKESTKLDKSDYKKSLAYDEINKRYDKNKSDIDDIRDYVTFRFSNFNETEHIIFRATIMGLTDTFTPTWNPINILGRADPAYIYSQFERTVSFNFTVAATSREELIQNYKRLNALSGYTTPTYSTHGMVAPFIRVTIGDYFKYTPAIITGLTYTVNDESPWEINLEGKNDVAQVPHVIDVQLGLTIINNYRPEFGGKFFMIDAISNPA